MKPSIIVHGGAWNIPDGLVEAHLKGCEAAAEKGYDELVRGESAVQAVVEAVAVMEDDPVFDAGIGSVLNQSGQVELDAIVMEGGALRFAVEKGFEPCTEQDLLVGHQLEDYREFLRTGVLRTREFFEGGCDTVGACAADTEGRVASATSTGGIPRKPAGRVGDSPLVGCGAYADDLAGAASATGWGEKIMAVLLARTAIDALKLHGDPVEACREAVMVVNYPALKDGACN